MTVNRMVYIPIDGSLNVEGETLFNIHLDWVPDNIHAIQWYGEEHGGEIEFNSEGGPFGFKPLNERFTELGQWQGLVDYFYEEKQRRLDAEIAAAEAAEAARDYWAEMRGIRDSLLMQSDWTQLPDVSLTEEQKTAWSVYRQQLRDLPGGITDPKPMVLAFYLEEIHPDWPVQPQ
jgi:hypothetical protein